MPAYLVRISGTGEGTIAPDLRIPSTPVSVDGRVEWTPSGSVSSGCRDMTLGVDRLAPHFKYGYRLPAASSRSISSESPLQISRFHHCAVYSPSRCGVGEISRGEVVADLRTPSSPNRFRTHPRLLGSLRTASRSYSLSGAADRPHPSPHHQRRGSTKPLSTVLIPSRSLGGYKASQGHRSAPWGLRMEQQQ